MPAYGAIDPAIDGLQFGSNPRIESAIAQEPIGYGVAVFGKDGVDNACWAAHQDQVLATGTGALVTSNSIAISFTFTPKTGVYAGIPQNIVITPVVFTTSDAATITAIIAAINANATVVAINAAVPGSLKGIASPTATAYQWGIQADAGDITALSAVVTLGASQITYSYAYSEFKRFLGVSAFTQRGGRAYGAGSSVYLQYDSVNIITLGEVWVSNGGVSVLNGQKAYVIVAPGATQGQFNSTPTAPNFDASLHWRSNNNSGRAVLGVRYGITP
jgi:hypothetical protein